VCDGRYEDYAVVKEASSEWSVTFSGRLKEALRDEVSEVVENNQEADVALGNTQLVVVRSTRYSTQFAKARCVGAHYA
jgi:hypothetical protein